jgi:calcium and integrin-binding protein 1
MISMIEGIAELSVNPFADRICQIFSSAGDGTGDCTFEDFLDMMSVFSDQAPKSVKAEHGIIFKKYCMIQKSFNRKFCLAFRIFDFDGDDMLSKADLKQVIQRLIGFNNQFSDLDMDQLIQNILEEADLDDDGSLSFAEFEHVIDKSSDFTK